MNNLILYCVFMLKDNKSYYVTSLSSMKFQGDVFQFLLNYQPFKFYLTFS